MLRGLTVHVPEANLDGVLTLKPVRAQSWEAGFRTALGGVVTLEATASDPSSAGPYARAYLERFPDGHPESGRRQAGGQPVDGHDPPDMEHLVLGPLGTGAIVFVFTIFMLHQREDLRDRIRGQSLPPETWSC